MPKRVVGVEIKSETEKYALMFLLPEDFAVKEDEVGNYWFIRLTSQLSLTQDPPKVGYNGN